MSQRSFTLYVSLGLEWNAGKPFLLHEKQQDFVQTKQVIGIDLFRVAVKNII